MQSLLDSTAARLACAGNITEARLIVSGFRAGLAMSTDAERHALWSKLLEQYEGLSDHGAPHVVRSAALDAIKTEVSRLELAVGRER